ncbi:MAG: threonylcarbamoyl-AMP synthase [Muribaculaceae bacterium]|nr:threonylcarbamoyl-AMP synthase [Muribaculaceae bacterium]
MEILTLYSADMRAIEQAAEALRAGKLIIYPTDTHPALAADSMNTAAIAALCRLKGVNPEKHTLTLVCDSIATAAQYARIDNRAFQMIKRNTPGPFTFILPPALTLPKVYKGRKEVGIRIPDNEIARALAAEMGHPLLSGSLGTADPLDHENSVELMLVDGCSEFNPDVQSSTIISLLDSASPEILREGSKEPE